MEKKRPLRDVSIGKFDILATYAYAQALQDGLDDNQAKQRGMVAAIMGAHARLGLHRGPSADADQEFEVRKTAAEKKKKTTITAESFDKQVADKLGPFFHERFLPAIQTLVSEGRSYDDVKRLVRIPGTWGAKISGRQFAQRAERPERRG
jgi:hypothetical protein